MRRFVTVLSLSLALPLFAIGCGSKQFWTATPAKGGGVDVEPMSAWVGGHKLWVRATVVNNSPDPIRVVRDGMTCTLPDGHKIPRASGSSTAHTAYFIPPGGSHAVYIEFLDQDFDWHEVPKVSVDFSKGIFGKNEQQITVSPMVITNAGDEK
ncbi:MAG: hypothetical protein ABIP39_13890 [Polyangiaceae bacterium]